MSTRSQLVLCAAAGLLLATLAASVDAEDAGAKPDLARGAEVFRLCSHCHGEEGQGMIDPVAPAIGGLPAWYVSMQLHEFRKGIRGMHFDDLTGMRMRPMSLALPGGEADIEPVAAYVSTLPKHQPKATIEGGDPARGAAFYAVCSGCHGPGAEGMQGTQSPPLLNTNDWYLREQITKYREGIRGTHEGDATGPVMRAMVGTLPNEQAVDDVVAYVLSLRK